MSSSLLHSHDEVLEARARLFRALSDENRLRIFQLLAESEEPLNVSAICDRVELPANLVSHHLRCLANCTLVEATQDGRKRYYDVARQEGVEMVRLADDCIKRDIEEVLGCEVVDRNEDGTG